ncbi:MAG: hypothetical protein RLZZ568_1675 [Cyanobacteriota bacterium]
MNPPYQVQWHPYQVPLAFPLTTAYGCWTHREGIILQLTDEHGQTSQGEVAPLPWFGTETLDQAREFCQQLSGCITSDQIQAIPDYLPCCQFAFGGAEWGLWEQFVEPLSLRYCQLLPTGKSVLTYLETVQHLPCQTVKWKIGIEDIATEQALFLTMLQRLPPHTHLRLDANGSLTLDEATQWLKLLSHQQKVIHKSIQIEYLEQPLPPDHLRELFTLAQSFPTVIALDESVASLPQLQRLYDQGWEGIYVLKGAIMGDPRRLHQWLTHHPIKVIFSSVFETAIARQQVLRLAQQWNLTNYAVGFSPLQG